MFILKKKAEPEKQIWNHIKRHYQGEKVAVVGVKKGLPQTFLRNKQVIFYESLTGESLLAEGKQFLERFAKNYTAFVFYLDCPTEIAEQLIDTGRALGVRVTVTVKEQVA
ncbi:hypothetical protein [Enterococcus xiangfangensis]|uniref:hypothetical protein n=1 Tax=Enterococcus xiangfangensis TaxID=1296537 RepID=UPI0010FA1E52|nr:hypothetical protein [Enterococcus xiangfangensis]MBM7712011.1 hypothetical protein [Enterococcus xiangfangensis]NBK08025.1 hypothetical protein [Enterococcus asini]